MQYRIAWHNGLVISGMNQSDKQKLLEAVKVLDHFVDHIPGGCSYWIDPDGGEHTADMGYVCEFLNDLIEYLEGENE